MYFNIPILFFLTKGVGIGKSFISKLVVQGLLHLYNKNLSLNLTKIKFWFMASTNKATFNIGWSNNDLILNILVQQTLTNISNLSLDSSNKFTCQYEQLQLMVID